MTEVQKAEYEKKPMSYPFLIEFLNRLRASNFLTKLVWGIRIHRKKMSLNWDMTTLCLKKAVSQYGFSATSYLDMGCGGLAILGQFVKKAFPEIQVSSVDYYHEFVANAIYNAEQNALELHVSQGNLFEGLTERYDLISFNPPYVPVDPKVRMQYPLTRFGGKDGTEVARRFLNEAADWLSVEGKVLLGINCYYVNQKRCETLILESGWVLLEVVSMSFNTARVFVIEPNMRVTTA